MEPVSFHVKASKVCGLQERGVTVWCCPANYETGTVFPTRRPRSRNILEVPNVGPARQKATISTTLSQKRRTSSLLVPWVIMFSYKYRSTNVVLCRKKDNRYSELSLEISKNGTQVLYRIYEAQICGTKLSTVLKLNQAYGTWIAHVRELGYRP